MGQDDSLAERVQSARAWLEESTPRLLTPDTVRNVLRWLEGDSYAEYRPALLELVEARNTKQLTHLFWEQIPFGTGGRRGPMSEFGSATINRRTIAESAWGLAHYVISQRQSQVAPDLPRVVIAFDARLRSEEFAQVTAQVMVAAGFRADLFDSPRATPLLSFAVRQLQCDCGVMISASHNPPSDNGFKAYWSHGGQVLPPHDGGIISRVKSAEAIPLANFDESLANGSVTIVSSSVDDLYVQAVSRLQRGTQRNLKILYTPLHGVGETSVARVLSASGFSDLEIFEPQRAMDGNFTHVPDQLPNPERSAVFGPAIDYAEDVGQHDLILASDPDADRIAVAVRTGDGHYACLSGNQLGSLLADYAVKHRNGINGSGYVLTTLVTTPLIGAIARKAGCRVVDELPVGFKNIGAAMEQSGAQSLIFAAEESLGYLAGDYCRDKDAALGALWCAELAAELKSSGHTLLDRLKELQREYGWHRESQISFSLPGPEGAARRGAIMRSLRENPPAQLGDAVVHRIRDYETQVIRSHPDFRASGTLPVQAGDLIFIDVALEGVTGQVALRPSGTEPKIKCYFFTQAHPGMPSHEGEDRSIDVLKVLESGIVNWMDQVP